MRMSILGISLEEKRLEWGKLLQIRRCDDQAWGFALQSSAKGRIGITAMYLQYAIT